MKKLLLILGVCVALVAIGLVSMYNSLVAGKVALEKAQSSVEVMYQRRANLVPQLVAVVRGAADFEKKTLIDVIDARNKATQIKIDPTNAESLAQFAASQKELSGAISRLLVTVEAYPQLTATENFRNLQSQLEGTENRITVSLGDFNTAATKWNLSVSQFPRMFIARMFGFQRVALFESVPGSDVPPEINLELK